MLSPLFRAAFEIKHGATIFAGGASEVVPGGGVWCSTPGNGIFSPQFIALFEEIASCYYLLKWILLKYGTTRNCNAGVFFFKWPYYFFLVCV